MQKNKPPGNLKFVAPLPAGEGENTVELVAVPCHRNEKKSCNGVERGRNARTPLGPPNSKDTSKTSM